MSQARGVLIKHVSSLTLPPVDHFDPREKFTAGEVDGVWIGFISEQAKRVLQTIERSAPQTRINVGDLKEKATNLQIVDDLGGDGKGISIARAHIWSFLHRQGGGSKSGDLLVNGYSNKFYIVDDDDDEWTLNVAWLGVNHGWDLSALPVCNPNAWDAGTRVLSRDS